MNNSSIDSKKFWKNEDAVNLMSHILTLWTLYQSAYFFEQMNKENMHKKKFQYSNNKFESYLRQPQIAQVVAMPKLLNVDNDHKLLVLVKENH